MDKNTALFWSKVKIDKDNVITFPVVDAEQIRRCSDLRENFDEVARKRQAKNKKNDDGPGAA